MATTGGSVPFAFDGSSLSPVHDAVSGMGSLPLSEVVALSVALAAVVVGLAGVLSHVRSGTAALDREIEELAAEREAYLAFASSVDDLSVGRRATAGSPQPIHAIDDSGTPVDDVKAAFEATVMAVDQYDETYGEPWLAHVASELDDGLAARLDAGGTVTAPVKEALHQHAMEAARQREQLLDVLCGERNAVEDAAETLSDIGHRLEGMDDRPLTKRSFDDLACAFEALDTERHRLRRLGRSRQRQIRRDTRRLPAADGPLHLQAYLYGEPPGRYPVLAGVAALSRRIETARDRVLVALTATV